MTMDGTRRPGSNRSWKRLFQFIKKSFSANAGAEEIWMSTIVIGFTCLAFGVLGLLMIWLWAAGVTHGSVHPSFSARSIAACDILVAGAAAAVGGLLGFLFGIPRTLDPASRAAVATAANQGNPMVNSQAALAANTNLERVSDWLTTLLIGATLVQIKDIVSWIGIIGHDLAGKTMTNDHIIPVIIIYYSALTFIGIYLITRLYLTYALQQTLFLISGSYSDYPLQKLKADLADALATGDPAELIQVNAEFNAWQFQGSDRDDPGLNYNLARMFAQMLAGTAASDNKDEIITKLKDAVQKASASPNIKKQLADDLASKWLTTQIEAVDADLKALTAAST